MSQFDPKLIQTACIDGHELRISSVMEERMSRNYKPEQIISMLREAEVAFSQGKTVGAGKNER